MPRLHLRMPRRWKIAIETALLVAVIVLVRVAVDGLSLEFVSPGPLLTSIVAGAIFVTGLIVAGTLADYKESERMPAEITAALDNIHEDARCISQTQPRFDLGALRNILGNVVRTFKEDLAQPTAPRCLNAINDLSKPILELEQLDVPANYIVRLRSEQGTLRKHVLRIYHIQRTEFLPSAYVLIQTIVLLIIAMLAFAKIEPGYEAVVLLFAISYFFIYLLKLLKTLDTPFRIGEHTMDDVSLFLLNEFAAGLRDNDGDSPTSAPTD